MAILKKSDKIPDDGKTTAKGPGDGVVINRWNNYLSWLGTKGKRGSTELDKGTEGMNMVNQYNSEMKSKDKSFVPITKQDVVKVQTVLNDYRNYAMGQIKSGKGSARLASGQEMPYNSMSEQQKQEFETNFMPQIAARTSAGKIWDDGIPGSATTATVVPGDYIGLVESGVRQPLQRVGFATETMRGRETQPAPKKKTSMVTKKN